MAFDRKKEIPAFMMSGFIIAHATVLTFRRLSRERVSLERRFSHVGSVNIRER